MFLPVRDSLWDHAGPATSWAPIGRLRRCRDYTLLLANGIGLTDLAKYVAGMDDELPKNSQYAARLRDAVEVIKPRALAFNGKKAASVFYRVPTRQLSYGRQSERIGATARYVLPSTAATASRGARLLENFREAGRAWRRNLGSRSSSAAGPASRMTLPKSDVARLTELGFLIDPNVASPPLAAEAH